MFKRLIVVALSFGLSGIPQTVYGDTCVAELSELGLRDQAVEKIRREVKISKDMSPKDVDFSAVSETKNELSLLLAQNRTEAILKEYNEKLEDIEEDLEAIRACNSAESCLLTRAKKIYLDVTILRKVLYGSMTAESRAKKLLREQVQELAGFMADQTLAASVNADPEMSESIRAEYDHRIRAALNNRSGDKGFFAELVGQIRQKYSDNWKARKLTQLRNRPEARADLIKNLFFVLGNQVGGQALATLATSKAGEHSNFSEQLWLYPNTVLLMTLQGELSAMNTEPIRKTLTTYQEALRAIPEFVHGKEGFTTGFTKRFTGFISLATLEYPITVILKAVNEMALGRSPITHWQGIIEGNVAFLVIFHSYLAFRWSVLDKWLNLNMIPGLREGTESKFENRLYSLLNKRSGNASGETFEEFRERLQDQYEAAQAQGKILGKFSFPDFRYKKYDAFRPFFKEDPSQLDMYDPDLAKAYSNMNRMRNVEYAWRELNSLLDATIVNVVALATAGFSNP